ncbi:hypothetical protein IKP85_05250 [bacterium]|nr:hypothetical protein [bacterium]
MVSIKPISSVINKVYRNCFEKPMVNLSESNFMNYGYDKFGSNIRSFIDGVGILSIILKDGVGCYMYVTQSLNNKSIPDDKRKFVAALDLTNGGLMIAAQIIMHKTISNKIIQSKMFNHLFGKQFDRNTSKMLHSILKRTDKFKDVTPEQVSEVLAQYKGDACDAFGSLTSLIAATTVGKRIIVPFIATPLASKAEKWMNKDNKNTTVDKETANMYNPNKHISIDKIV